MFRYPIAASRISQKPGVAYKGSNPLPSAFVNPTSLSGLVTWTDVNSLGLTNGNPVTEFTDLSGLNNHGSGSVKATYRTGITVGGKGVADFSTSSFYTYGNVMSGKTAGTVFVVMKRFNDPPAVDVDAGLWWWGTDAVDDAVVPWTNGYIYDEWGTTARKSAGDPTPSFATAFRTYCVSSESGNWTCRIDGTQQYTTATNTVGFRTAPLLGKNKNNRLFKGYISAFIVYGRALSTAEKGQVETYLENYK
jgi:large repetitive protein